MRWFVLFLLGVLYGSAASAAERVYTFAVVPQQAAGDLAEIWSPFLSRVSRLSGVPLRFVTAPDIVTFEQRLAHGDYDLAYMNPYHYTVYHQLPGYTAFAKEQGRQLNGILVVRADSPLQNIQDLQGATLVFPSPAAFAASILPRAELRKQGIVFTPKFVASHDSVYLNVVRGFYPAGGGILRTFEMLDEDARKQLRVLWTTPPYTPHAFAAHPQLPAGIAQKLLAAMTALSQDDEGRSLLKSLGMVKGITTARDADWDDVRKLKITELDSHAQ